MLKAAKQYHSMALILAIFVIFIFINKPITAQPVDKMPESAKVELMGANGKMPTAIFFPDGDGEKPLILVVHTSGGLFQSEIDYAIRLQKEGFIAVVPDFYTPYNITPRTKRLTWSKYQEAIHEDFVKIIDQVKKMSKVPSNKVFAVGFSNGGYWAAFLAANGDVDAGISYYGAYSEGGLCRGRNGLDNCSIGSVLSDESSPLLLIHGDEDHVVKPPIAERFEGLWGRIAGDDKLESYWFEGADHAFDKKDNYGGKYFDEKATEEAWEIVLDYLKKKIQ